MHRSESKGTIRPHSSRLERDRQGNGMPARSFSMEFGALNSKMPVGAQLEKENPFTPSRQLHNSPPTIQISLSDVKEKEEETEITDRNSRSRTSRHKRVKYASAEKPFRDNLTEEEENYLLSRIDAALQRDRPDVRVTKVLQEKRHQLLRRKRERKLALGSKLPAQPTVSAPVSAISSSSVALSMSVDEQIESAPLSVPTHIRQQLEHWRLSQQEQKKTETDITASSHPERQHADINADADAYAEAMTRANFRDRRAIPVPRSHQAVVDTGVSNDHHYYEAEVEKEEVLEVLEVDRAACDCCGRQFAVERLNVHQRVCRQQKQKEARSKKKRPTKAAPTRATADSLQKEEAVRQLKEKTKLKWRQQHQQFIHTIRSAKADSSGERPPLEGVTSSDMGMGMGMESVDDRIACPHCSRKFAEDALERHAKVCERLSQKNSRSRGGDASDKDKRKGETRSTRASSVLYRGNRSQRVK